MYTRLYIVPKWVGASDRQKWLGRNAIADLSELVLIVVISNCVRITSFDIFWIDFDCFYLLDRCLFILTANDFFS